MEGTGAGLLVDVMRANRIDHVFGVPGGHLLKFYDALYGAEDISIVLTKHESGAAFMGVGYAQVSGKVPACVGTVGPGATNLVTGVATAFMDSVPMLVLTAQVGTSAVGKGGLQEATGEGRSIDHLEVFRPITKYSSRVFNVDRLVDTASNALRTAVSGRPGPVHLDILADVFAAPTGHDRQAPITQEPVRTRADDGAVAKAARLIAGSHNPAILAGAGAMDAHEEVMRLSKEWSIPVATTLRGKGVVPEDYQLALGCVGLYGTIVANKYLRTDIDVLIAIGSSFHEFTTHNWDPRFIPTKALVQIDIDPWEIGKNYRAEVGLVGDSKSTLQALLKELSKTQVSKKADAVAVMKMKAERGYFADGKMASDEVPLKPQRVMKALRSVLPRDAVVFGDIGNSLTWVESYFEVYGPKTFLVGSGLASMGYGVAASIGGKLAAPDKVVACVCGDGDFQMQGMELMTAVNYGIPVKWFILDNERLGMIQDVQEILFKGRTISTEFRNPDYVKFAEACGAAGYRVDKPSSLEPVLREAVKDDRPTVVDIVIDPSERPPFDARAEAMVSAWGTRPPLLKKLSMIPEVLRRR